MWQFTYYVNIGSVADMEAWLYSPDMRKRAWGCNICNCDITLYTAFVIACENTFCCMLTTISSMFGVQHCAFTQIWQGLHNLLLQFPYPSSYHSFALLSALNLKTIQHHMRVQSEFIQPHLWETHNATLLIPLWSVSLLYIVGVYLCCILLAAASGCKRWNCDWMDTPPPPKNQRKQVGAVAKGCHTSVTILEWWYPLIHCDSLV